MIITSYRGHAFAPDYDVWIGDGSHRSLPAVGARLAERVGAWPVLSGIQRPGKRFLLFTWILGTDIAGLRAQLLHWFDPEDEAAHVLVAADDDGSRTRYVRATCESMQPVIDGGTHYSNRLFVATMVVSGDVRWRMVSPETETWLITGDGDTETVNNPGDDEAYPMLTVVPTAEKTTGLAYQYARWCPVKWRALYTGTAYPTALAAFDTNALVETATTTTLNGAVAAGDTTITLTDASAFALRGMAYITDAVNGDEQVSWTAKAGNDLTGVTRGIGGTAAVNHGDGCTVAVSKMLVNGNDLRVYVNGAEDVNRWLVGMNTNSTVVWLNLNWAARAVTTLDAGIAAGDPATTISVASTVGFPGSGILLINDEAFVYTGTDGGDTFTGVTRAAHYTVAADHALNDDVYWIQHNIYLYYGDAGAAAPATNNDYLPAFALATSSNTLWEYDEFGADAGLRTASWTTFVGGGAPTFYTANRVTDADPWEEIGVETEHVGAGQQWGYWVWYNPCYVTNFQFINGEKWADDRTEWAGNVHANNDWPGGIPATQYMIPAPAADSTWEAWSCNTAVAAAARWIVMGCGSFDIAILRVEAADVTLTLNNTYTPDPAVHDEVVISAYVLAVAITNNETGDEVRISYNTFLNVALEIDTDAKTVTDLADESNQRQALTLNQVRRHWLRLLPGDNELQYNEDGVTGVTVSVEFEARQYD